MAGVQWTRWCLGISALASAVVAGLYYERVHLAGVAAPFVAMLTGGAALALDAR